MNVASEKLREFVVVCQAQSLARFTDRNSSLTINTSSVFGSIVICYRTHFTKIENGPDLARHLFAEIRGHAPSLEDAADLFRSKANNFIPTISFCTNAHISDLEIEYVFEVTQNALEKEFFQNFLPSAGGLPKISRKIDTDGIIEFLNQLNNHAEFDRIVRSIEQYRLGLAYWRRGSDAIAVSHLFMGIEALKVAIYRQYIEKNNLTHEEFAKINGLSISDSNGEPYRSGKIKNDNEAFVRRSIIFQDDIECHDSAKNASDGFEHGFLSFEEIRNFSNRARDKTAYYLRLSILRLTALDSNLVLDKLNDTPYDHPMDTMGLTRYLRGHLVGDTDQLAQDGYDYPWLEVNSVFKQTNHSDPDKISFEENITPHIGKDVIFRPNSYEVHGPQVIKKSD